MKLTSIVTLLGVAMLVGGCSALKRQNAKTVDSGDARPLFPVTTENTHGLDARSLDGHWFIKSVNGKTITGLDDYDWPFLEFVPSEARYYGNDGCNVINGSYRLAPGQKISFSNMATTMRLCPDDSLSYPIATAMEHTAAYSTSALPDGTTVLSFHNAQNRTVMTLRHSDIDFINGPWQVAEINGRPCTAANARLVFDVDSKRISGNAGCNRLNGELLRDPKTGASLQFSNLSTTRMMCPDMEEESALLIALEEVTSARKANNGQLELLAPGGTVLVRLTKLTKADLQNADAEE